MTDDMQYMAKVRIAALYDLLAEFMRGHPNFIILGFREALNLVRSTEPDERITKTSVGSYRLKNPAGRGHIYELKVSIPGYSFRLKMVPADPAICLLNTVLLTEQGGEEIHVAEQRAQEKLRSHISDDQWLSYQMSASFVEMSRKSSMLYLFRRGFPTLAFKSSPEGNRFIAGLCLHAEGYEPFSWAGYLCPTDDVITALLLMRSQEQKFWAKAGHHHLNSPMLGI